MTQGNLLLVVLVGLMAGCSSTPKTGNVEGSAFLLMQNGDTKRGSGLQIHLLRDPDSVVSRVESICDRRARMQAPLDARYKALSDSQDVLVKYTAPGWYERSLRLTKRQGAVTDSMGPIRDSAIVGVARVIVGASIDTTSTGIDAHYRFLNVPPGRYAIFGQWSIGDHDYRWLAPAMVEPGKTTHRDLDNSVERGSMLACRM